jgi:glyoxylase-like metal-dependent hydrolase (beta-lactamase superfamily II)
MWFFEDDLMTILMQVEEGTADVEWKLDGNGPWNIGTDFQLIHTPGHTQVRNSTSRAPSSLIAK